MVLKESQRDLHSGDKDDIADVHPLKELIEEDSEADLVTKMT